jgi:carotenoid 1,2-hydratase
MTEPKALNGNLHFSSSIAGDVWNASPTSASPPAYQRWYFDAVKDDGQDAIALSFFDNYILSPRYNAYCRGDHSQPAKFPAFEFCYYRQGKLLHRAVREFPAGAFSADGAIPSCTIGTNSFQFESAPYGEGFLLRLDIEMNDGRRMKANLEWLVVEGNLLPTAKDPAGSHHWNLVAPRCDVTGKIEFYRRAGKIRETVQFRGTGYHDSRCGQRWLPADLEYLRWGRAHFADITAVFYQYRELNSAQPEVKLLLSSVSGLEEKTAFSEGKNFSRNIYQLRYPRRLTIYRRDNVRLRLKQTQLIESSACYLRFLSEAVLTIGDGKPRKTIAITEMLAPKALKSGWLDWLTRFSSRRIKLGSASASNAE